MPKALVVVTSTQKYPNKDKATGLWLGEAVHFIHVLQKNGWYVDLVSPKGGLTPLDPTSLGQGVLQPVDWQYYANPQFRQKLANTLKPSEIKPEDYKVIYYAGGHGTVFDFLENPQLQMISRKIYENGGIVSAVCHGPVGIINIKLSNGQHLIKGKKVTGFSNQEETAIGLHEVVPFLLEDELKKKGAFYSKGANWGEFVVIDERLITGQNPASAKLIGQHVVSFKF